MKTYAMNQDIEVDDSSVTLTMTGTMKEVPMAEPTVMTEYHTSNDGVSLTELLDILHTTPITPLTLEDDEMPFVPNGSMPLYAAHRQVTNPPLRMLRDRQHDVMHYEGRSREIVEWAEQIGMNPITLTSRLLRGWTIDRALNEPLHAQPTQETA